MRYLVFADLHGYSDFLAPLESQVGRLGGYDSILFLGDAIGRGPDPIGCLRWLQERQALCIQGNWEYWVVTQESELVDAASLSDLDKINSILHQEPDWKQYILSWADQESPDSRVLLTHSGLSAVGSSGSHPVLTYVDTPGKAEAAFEVAAQQHIVCGHTHQRGYFYHSTRRKATSLFEPLLHPGSQRSRFDLSVDQHRYLINVGTLVPDLDRSPGNHLGSFGILDAENGHLSLHLYHLDV